MTSREPYGSLDLSEQVSRICAELDAKVATFRAPSLASETYKMRIATCLQLGHRGPADMWVVRPPEGASMHRLGPTTSDIPRPFARHERRWTRTRHHGTGSTRGNPGA